MNCPYSNEKCRAKWGKKDRPAGCMGDNPTAQWARWYINKFTNYNKNKKGENCQ